MFKGKVSRTSHDGGLLVEFSGSCPALGTILVDSNNQYIGKVHGVVGNLNEAFIHVHSLDKSLTPGNIVGITLTIRAKETKKEFQRNKRVNSSDARHEKKQKQHYREKTTNLEAKYSKRKNKNTSKIHGDNDWICKECNNSNFSFRTECNRCGKPIHTKSKIKKDKNKDIGPKTRYQRDKRPSRSEQLGKDKWKCSCGSENFASNNKCFKCGTYQKIPRTRNSTTRKERRGRWNVR